jgi:surface carbohydrate biosynthesis protein
MFLNKVDIIFLIEHKDRELESIKLLSEELHREYGYTSLISSINMGLLNAICSTPKLIAMPFLREKAQFPTNIMTLRFGRRVKYLNMNWEQFLSKSNLLYKKQNGAFAREVAYHVAWHDPFKNYLISNGVNPKNITITGNISYANLKISTQKKSEIEVKISSYLETKHRRRFNEIVFFPLNYAWSFLTDDQINKRISNGYDSKVAWEYRSYSIACRNEFLKWLIPAAIAFPDKLFLVRPHPNVLPNQYHELIPNLPENILVTHDFTIHDWIMVAGKVLSSWSTSILDASLAGKKCALMTPYARPDWLDVEWNNQVDNISNLESFLEFIGSKGPVSNSPYIESFIQAQTSSIDKLSAMISGLVEKKDDSAPNTGEPIKISISLKAVLKLAVISCRQLFIKAGFRNLVNKVYLRDYFPSLQIGRNKN